MSGCEDVAVRVGCADDQVYFVEAVFDFVEANKLNVILPFIFELRLVAMIAPDRFFVRTATLFHEAFTEDSRSDNHDRVLVFGFGGKVAKCKCFDLFGLEFLRWFRS